jgi:hypothetical protein
VLLESANRDGVRFGDVWSNACARVAVARFLQSSFIFCEENRWSGKQLASVARACLRVIH